MSEAENLDVAVVIPTCDRFAFLGAALDSVLGQRRPFAEVIVVDSGRTDASEVTNLYGDRITLIRLPVGSGVQLARNAGISAARSRWVATLDDDDLQHADYLERAAPALLDGRADIVFVDHRKFLGDRFEKKTNFEAAPAGYWRGVPRPAEGAEWSFVGKFPVSRLLHFIGFYPSTMLIRKDLFASAGGYDRGVQGIATEDIEFLVRALQSGKLSIVWAHLVDYRIHALNTSGAADRQKIGRWQVFEYILAKGPNDLSVGFRGDLRRNLQQRRRDIFDFTFHKCKFDHFDDVSRRLMPSDWTPRRRLYRLVSRTPDPLRTPLTRVVSAPARLQSFLRRRQPKVVPVEF